MESKFNVYDLFNCQAIFFSAYSCEEREEDNK